MHKTKNRLIILKEKRLSMVVNYLLSPSKKIFYICDNYTIFVLKKNLNQINLFNNLFGEQGYIKLFLLGDVFIC